MRCSSSFSSSSSSSSSFSSPKNLLVLQEEDWDCGLACALMVLRALQYSMSSIQGGSGRRALPSMKELRERCETQSIWTIDLAHLLRHYGVGVRMRTVFPGVDPSHQHSQFYKDVISQDQKRVTQLFRRAADAGISVERKGTTSSEMLSLVADHGHVLIVLVDRTILLCDECALADKAFAEKLKEFGSKADSFLGHFVVLTDISQSRISTEKRNSDGGGSPNNNKALTDNFSNDLKSAAVPPVPTKGSKRAWFYDPGSRVENHQCSVPFDQFEKARLQSGTDQDILIIKVNEQKKPKS